MSFLSSKNNDNDFKFPTKLIIIKKDRINSAKTKGSTLTIEKGKYKIQLNMGLNSQNLDKSKIDNTLKNIEKSVEIYNNQMKKSKEQDYVRLKVESNDVQNYSYLNDKKNLDSQNENQSIRNSEENKTIKYEDETSIKNNNIKIQKDLNKNLFFEKEKENNILSNLIIYNENDDYSDFDNQIYEKCQICEKTNSIQKFFFSSCKMHKICRKCIKNYYEDIIEQGERNLKCPIYKCKNTINIILLKKIISEQHYNLLNGKPNVFSQTTNIHLQSKYDFYEEKEKLKLYTQRHVLDINSNENFFMFNKFKNIYCPKCNEPALFTKIKGHFIKCLNCYHRICKYCLKDYDEKHMDIAFEEHCKVYFRNDNNFIKKNNVFILFFIQLFFISASYYFCFYGGFLYINNAVKCIFSVKKDSNPFIWVIIYFISFILFICAVPVILISLPYFPIFTSIFN